jgi:trehalose 6-phosphate synthase
LVVEQDRTERVSKRYDLVVASNRGPLSFQLREDSLESIRGSGGLISGLLAALPGREALWVSAITTAADSRARAEGLFKVPLIDLATVFIDSETYSRAYDRIANETLWLSYHGLFDLTYEPSFDEQFAADFSCYRRYNQSFADAIMEAAEPDATVLVNDYHLNLIPGILRRHRPDLTICFFVHTPFPSAAEFRILPSPVRHELLASFSCADSIGFHAELWRRNFRECLAETSFSEPQLLVEPLAIDLNELQQETHRPDVIESGALLDEEQYCRPLIVRVDRLELSKNLIRGFRAFDQMLKMWPHTQSRCTFLALCYPSRTSVEKYQRYRIEVENVVQEINDRYGTSTWIPIIFKTDDNYPRSLAALEKFDVLIVNPVRDGLNLVAMEGLAVNRRSGTVVLSQDAGAYELLADTTIGVNPFDITETAHALYQAAFAQTEEERFQRSERAKSLLARRTPGDWLDRVTLRGGADS